jgi:transcriptional regulator with XRE-family HTH domain
MLSFPNSDEYIHFIAELRAARDEAGRSQAELAARLKTDRTVITKAEGGVRRLDLSELRAWLIALDVELLCFVGRLEVRLDRNAKPTQPALPRRAR